MKEIILVLALEDEMAKSSMNYKTWTRIMGCINTLEIKQ